MDDLDFPKNKALFMFCYYVLCTATFVFQSVLNHRDVLGRMCDRGLNSQFCPLLAL